MSRGDNWIAMDKNLKQAFSYIRRPFSLIEAMYSYSLDRDNGVEGTISGYSTLWSWSRNKVRRFVKNINEKGGHTRDSKRTFKGHPIHFIDSTLWIKKDSQRTGKGQVKDSTINPISYKPNKEITQEIIDFTVSFVDFMCEKYGKLAPARTDSLVKNSILTVGDLIRLDGFDLAYIKTICKWAIGDSFFSKNFYSLSRLRTPWGKNDLKKFQEMANGFESKKRNRVDGLDHFKGNVYEGTPESDIKFLD